jgi:hypothetical protein
MKQKLILLLEFLKLNGIFRLAFLVFKLKVVDIVWWVYFDIFNALLEEDLACFWLVEDNFVVKGDDQVNINFVFRPGRLLALI